MKNTQRKISIIYFKVYFSNACVNSSIDLKNLAASGLGIVHLPNCIIKQELESGKLIPILEDFALPALGMYAVYPSQKFLSKKMQAFLDFLITLKIAY